MRNSRWAEQIARMRERLQEPLLWFPFPVLIAFGLVITLRGHLLTGLNHRLGSRADVLELTTKSQNEGGIWLGIFLEKNHVVVVTDDRTRFQWPLASQSADDLKPLVSFLKKRVKKEAYASSLHMETDLAKTKAVLAVDQKLNFVHIRPLVYALAEAHISSYGFETKLIR